MHRLNIGILYAYPGMINKKGSIFKKTFFVSFSFDYTITSMIQLLLHTFAHLTGPSLRFKAKLLPNEIEVWPLHIRILLGLM